MTNQQQEIKTRKKEKDGRTLMYRLKDFDIYCNVAEKLRQGQRALLRDNEILCLNNLLRTPCTTKTYLHGLFECHNSDGHMSDISKAKVAAIRNLYEKNKNLSHYYNVKGGKEKEVYQLLNRTLTCIPFIQSYLRKRV